MSSLWNSLFYQPLLQSLIFFYKALGNNFGLAIITLTILIRSALIPLILPTLRSSQRLRDLQPEFEKLKEKYKKIKDKRQFQQEQLKLYRQHNINPAAGCLPFLLQFVVLIALYRVFNNFIQTGLIDDTQVKMDFLWLNLAQPDAYYILPVLAGLSQFFLARLMQPPSLPQANKKNKSSAQKEDMATAMQKQMSVMMPLMTVIISIKLPSGLALYWLTTTFFSVIQQRFFSK